MLEIIGTILAGINAVVGVTKLLRETESDQPNAGVKEAISRTEARVVALEAALHRRPEEDDRDKLQHLYNALVETVRTTEPYSSKLEIVPAKNGRVRIVLRRKRPRKSVALRDPEGEYGEQS